MSLSTCTPESLESITYNRPDPFDLERFLASISLSQLFSVPISLYLVSIGLHPVFVWILTELLFAIIFYVIIYIITYVKDLRNQIGVFIDRINNLNQDIHYLNKTNFGFIVISDETFANIINMDGTAKFIRIVTLENIGEREVHEYIMNFCTERPASYSSLNLSATLLELRGNRIDQSLNVRSAEGIEINTLRKEMQWTIQFSPINRGEQIKFKVQWSWEGAFNFESFKDEWAYTCLTPHHSYRVEIVFPVDIIEEDFTERYMDNRDYNRREISDVPMFNFYDKGQHNKFNDRIVIDWGHNQIFLLYTYRLYWALNKKRILQRMSE